MRNFANEKKPRTISSSLTAQPGLVRDCVAYRRHIDRWIEVLGAFERRKP